MDKYLDLKKLLPMYMKDIDKMLQNIDIEDESISQQTLNIMIYKDSTITLNITIDEDNNYAVAELVYTITLTDLYDLLFRVLYYYPEEEIVDIDGFSYQLKDLEGQFVSPYSRQYKTLMKRLEYIKQL